MEQTNKLLRDKSIDNKFNSLANAATVDITNFQSKRRLLSDFELLVIGQFVESVKVDYSLLRVVINCAFFKNAQIFKQI